jgi:hypothetical protein
MHTGTWAGRKGVGPRTTAHVPDCSQIGALRQPGPHMLGPLGANAVDPQAGVRPPTQSVTHTDTDRENEATQGYTHTQFREGRPKADAYTRTASAHVVIAYRERERHTHRLTYLSHSFKHTHTHRHIDTHTQQYLCFSRTATASLPRTYLLTHTLTHT